MDSFGDYWQEIGRVPLLTDQEEIYCSHQIQAWLQYVGGPEAAPTQVQRRGKRAKERLMSGNLRLVVSVCKKNLGRGLELQDMVQEGSLGLSRAAENLMQPGATSFRPTPTGGFVRGSTEQSASRPERFEFPQTEGSCSQKSKP